MFSISAKWDAVLTCAKVEQAFVSSILLLHCFKLLGEELIGFLSRLDSMPDRIVYVGDGSNDFCPILHLKK